MPHTLDHFYIDGAFVEPHGRERIERIDPATEIAMGSAALGDAEDARRAVAAAHRALPGFSRTSTAERIGMLERLHDAVLARTGELRDATIEEYGGPVSRATWVSKFAAQTFLDAASTVRDYAFERPVGHSTLVMEAVGVAALITPWNSTAGSICGKVAMAIAAGCPSVVKPSELSPLQSLLVAQAVHEAGLPPGVVNFVNGRGDAVGSALCTHPDVAKISFTGSTATGKAIARMAIDTFKRLSLGLGGKSPTIVLDDADLDTAVPAALTAAFQNSGQACIAGSRLLVPEHRLDAVLDRVRRGVAALRVGDPSDPSTTIGPMVNAAQFERVQRYIRRGIEEGATVVTGGEGRPDGLPRGYFVRPTVFSQVTNDMAIAQEEIFGPVLCVLTYRDEDEAVRIANDSLYGLHGYVFSSDLARAQAVARRMQVGRVAINGMQHDPLAPFGGYKASGWGREYGVQGLESFLEAKVVMTL
ncbi:aldehyde dehydrogenase family protein [Piscinibacter gummiphilus]|uniref:aldehyde dehydrogenase (NAD(+)) n=1 Tax=Piscinibacter gummiphilus TaxID=946333 RepID=A0A1W6L3F8_9BURK|nr:aldehyde dehydrogenase family protein [Piscinibacter gummiphilus]ARN18698.1 aldehyde dehydrogenase [Piscinibacter gummiphilus]ATU63335.1 aldehyde dehydrogenase family protein [Piscinibacter gummiphilus]GLS95845.1 aldehyde dehydrogenase [Piscinibacter gummiphilus]